MTNIRQTSVLLLTLLLGCRTALEDPPIQRFGPESLVVAWDAESADRVQAVLERLVPLARSMKGVQKPPPAVYILREGMPGGLSGLTFSFVVLLDGTKHRVMDHTLAHELSHWFRDEEWGLLPNAIEEGLADHVATLILPEEGGAPVAHHPHFMPATVGLQEFRSLCAAELRDWPERAIAEEMRLRAVGFTAASAIGVDGLRALCVRAKKEDLDKVPAEWIFDAMPAKISESDTWKARLYRRLDVLDNEAIRLKGLERPSQDN